MRTFIAIEFPDVIAHQVAVLVHELQQFLRERSAPACLRWLPVHNIHITLRFLGDTTPAQVQTLATRLREIGECQAPFALTIGGIGGFPNLHRPRVLWLGVGGDLPQLNALQAAVEQTAQLVGFSAEQRPFSAHITLARAQRSASQGQLRAVGSHLAAYAATTHLALHVNAIVHLRSDLKPDGAVYTPLGQFPLCASSASVV